MVSILADNSDPSPGESVLMTAVIANAPNGDPTYPWQRKFASGWGDTPGTGSTKRVRFSSEGTRTYRVVVTFPEGDPITSEP